jgi:hypothetical protein
VVIEIGTRSFSGIVGKLGVNPGIDGDRTGLPEQERIAVGLGVLDDLRADDAAGAAAVFDHDRLS